ncbi:hypothetical protein Tco_0542092 [Tanacetum coccineum]
MERGFLTQKGSGGGRGVKENNKDFAAKDRVLPSVTDETVVKDPTAEMDKIRSLDDTTVLGSFPPLSTSVTTTAGNALGKSSYANVTSKPSRNKVNVPTLFPPGGNGINVGKYGLVHSMFSSSTRLFSFQLSSMHGLDVMLENDPWFSWNNPLTAFSEDGLSAIATKLGDVELKYNIVMAMPKITREGNYACNVRVEYEWKPPSCSSCKIFGHIHEECLKNTGAAEKKTVKIPSQTS